MAQEEIFVEENPKPTVLVVEDNAAFAEMARKGLSSHYSVTVARTLEDAMDILATARVSFILSDVMFPVGTGHPETDNSKVMLEIALKKVVPMAFVTRGDHHGQITGLITSEKPQISIKCLSLGDIYHSMVLLGKKKGIDKRTDFNFITASHSKVMESDVKGEEIWQYAISSLANVSAKRTPISGAMNQVSNLFGGRCGFEIRKDGIALTSSKLKR